MKILFVALLTLIVFSFATLANGSQNANNEKLDEKSKVKLLSYAKLVFLGRRNEQRSMIKDMLKSKYEKQYKLLDLSYKKINEMLKQTNETLNSMAYESKRDGFPTTNIDMQGTVVMVLDNCCMSAENLLHFPDISYRIFRSNKWEDWNLMMNWCHDFVSGLHDIVDGDTLKLMSLQINEDLRSDDYINPYAESSKKNPLENKDHSSVKQKQRNKIKKGPQLSASKQHNEL